MPAFPAQLIVPCYLIIVAMAIFFAVVAGVLAIFGVPMSLEHYGLLVVCAVFLISSIPPIFYWFDELGHRLLHMPTDKR